MAKTVQIDGRRPEKKESGVVLPKEMPSRRWSYFHDPIQGWAYDDRHGWIPDLCQLSWTHGCNSITVGADGTVDRSHAQGRLAQSGFAYIDPYDRRLLPGGYAPYWMEYDVVWGGKRMLSYKSVFERGVRIGSKTTWSRDDTAWFGFLAYLLKEGIIDPMPAEVLEAKLDVQRKRIGRLEKMGGNPLMAEKHQAEIRRMEEMVEAFRKQFPSDDDAAEVAILPSPRSGKER